MTKTSELVVSDARAESEAAQRDGVVSRWWEGGDAYPPELFLDLSDGSVVRVEYEPGIGRPGHALFFRAPAGVNPMPLVSAKDSGLDFDTLEAVSDEIHAAYGLWVADDDDVWSPQEQEVRS